MKHLKSILLFFRPKAFLTLYFIFFIGKSNAQDQRAIDSLLEVLKLASHDTVTIKTLSALSDVYKDNDPVTAIKYCNEALKVIEPLTLSADTQFRKNMIYEAAGLYNNLGYIYKINGNFKAAGDNYYKALKHVEKVNDPNVLSLVAGNLGALYKKTNDLDKSLEFFEIARKAALKGGDKERLGSSYTSIGSIYNVRHDTALALKFYRMALQVHAEAGNNDGMGTAYNNIGYLYLTNSEPEKSLDYFKKSLQMVLPLKKKGPIGLAYSNMGRAFLKLNMPDSALLSYQKALEVAEKIADAQLRGTVYAGLYRSYKAGGKYDQALLYMEKYRAGYDSMFNADNTAGVVKAEMQYDFEKKQALADAEQEKLDALSLQERKRQRIIIAGIAAILIAVIVFSIVVFRNNREKKKINTELDAKNKLVQTQKDLVEEKQKEILDSIQYAEKIQKTLIANQEFLNENVSESFVLYKPKDIVSGDFYWATKREGKFYLAVCDSTGHGVPGAFMSLLNISFLNEAINEKFITDPAGIFEHVRKRLIESISQYGRQDGMDGILVCIDENSTGISFCAANISPILISGNYVNVLPHDKMPVGKGERNNSFVTQKITARPGDMLYLFTDGYPDQFGGEKGKKFKNKPLQELFLSVANKNIHQQKEIIDTTFVKWKGNLEQIDDVCVVGLRLNPSHKNS